MVNSTDEEEKKFLLPIYAEIKKQKNKQNWWWYKQTDILFKMLRKTPSSLMNYFFSTVIDLCFFYNNYQ